MPLVMPTSNDPRVDLEEESEPLSIDETRKVLNLLYVRALGELEVAAANLRDLPSMNLTYRDLMHRALGRQIVAYWEGRVCVLNQLRLLFDGRWSEQANLDEAVRDVRAFSRTNSGIISVR